MIQIWALRSRLEKQPTEPAAMVSSYERRCTSSDTLRPRYRRMGRRRVRQRRIGLRSRRKGRIWRRGSGSRLRTGRHRLRGLRLRYVRSSRRDLLTSRQLIGIQLIHERTTLQTKERHLEFATKPMNGPSDPTIAGTRKTHGPVLVAKNSEIV